MLHSIIMLNAITPIHNGAGEGLGVIDRPIVRERITNFPYIQGSSIKGVLKDAYRSKIKKDELDTIFGPDEGDKHSSAMAFGDASLLFMPVRSLKGGFVWATTPLILYRFLRIIEMAGLSENFPELKALLAKPEIHSGMSTVFINPDANGLLLITIGQDTKIILEEYPLSATSLPELAQFAIEIARFIFTNSSIFLTEEFKKRLVLLPAEIFAYFVTHATEVVPNIKIDPATGTSTQGLRYSEYLPAETVLYCLLGFDKPRKEINNQPADENGVKEIFLEHFPPRIQIGADETKGKGFVELSVIGGKDGTGDNKPQT